MISHQAWRIMFIGLDELDVQEQGELLSLSSPMQTPSMLKISLRFCKVQDNTFLLNCLQWLALLVMEVKLQEVTFVTEVEGVLATGVRYLDQTTYLLAEDLGKFVRT